MTADQRSIAAAATGALLLLSACAHTPDAPDVLAEGELMRATGGTAGAARLLRTEGGVSLSLIVAGIAPGTYGAHIHSVGRCEGPAFTSAGAHWNPAMRQHGRLNPQGTHAGDLPNLVVAADGAGSLSAPVTAALDGDSGLFDADGAAVVVHAMADDEMTDPTGNSGARILCAVLQPVGRSAP